MSIAVGSAAVVVVFWWSWSGQGGEGPEESDGVESVVFDAAAGDGEAAAGGSGDGGGAGVGLECAGVGESGGVVADFGEHPGAGEISQAWEAGDDLVVGVLGEGLGGCGGELVGVGAFGGQGGQQRVDLAAHGVFHQSGLP